MVVLPFDGSWVSWITLGAGVLISSLALSYGIRHHAHLLTLLGGIGLALVSFWAQPVEAQPAQDAAELVAGAQARGRSAEAALREWVDEIAQRRPAYQIEARALAQANGERLRQGLGLVSGDHQAAAEQMMRPPAGEGAIYVAVSLSMPPQALRRLADDAGKSGAQLVIRGLVQGSLPKTVAALKQVFDDKTAAGVAIDPTVFRAFQIKAAPTFIVARAPVEPCVGLDCTPNTPVFDRLSGNISLAEALRQIGASGDGAPDVARAALYRLER